MEQERIMFSIFLFLFILSVQRNGFAYVINIAECTLEFTQKYPEAKNDSKVVGYNRFYINYCYVEDIPNNIHFGIKLAENEPELTDSLKVEFQPSKSECIYGITLLVNPSIKDERECENYKFEETGDLESKIHTRQSNVCVFNNTNQVIRYNKNIYNNSTVSLYEDSISLWFKHIFTGCYALRFRIDVDKYITRGPVFLNTTYQRTEVKEPLFVCKYNSRSNLDKRHEVTNYTLDISLLADTGLSLIVELISQRDKDPRGCVWKGQSPLYKWRISLEASTSRKVLKDGYCDVKLIQLVNGKYMKSVRCNFQVETQITLPCFLYRVDDERCRRNTIWKPPYSEKGRRWACLWVMHCDKVFDSWLHVENVSAYTIKSDNLLSASSYLLLPIIANVVIISAVIGMLYFYHYWRIRKEEVNLYINPQHDDSDPLKSIDLGIIDNVNEKKISHDNPPCDDIVLLYTNSSTSFMARMRDLRETLAKMCSCSVHDWHDGAVWNEVAKVDAVSWFTKLLDNGCRVVWVDTPATRSVVISNSKNDESSLDKLNKYYQIHDFRDMAFCVVLKAAKTRINDATQQYRRHFIVRFEGLESTTNMDDPFLDLSPHARYCMPQHLMQLCSDLSVVKPVISKYKTKVEEDLHRVFVFQRDAVASEIYKDDVNNVK